MSNAYHVRDLDNPSIKPLWALSSTIQAVMPQLGDGNKYGITQANPPREGEDDKTTFVDDDRPMVRLRLKDRRWNITDRKGDLWLSEEIVRKPVKDGNPWDHLADRHAEVHLNKVLAELSK